MAADGETRWFPSKVDWWLGAILALLAVGSLVAVAVAIASGHGVGASLAGCAAVGALYGGLVFPMRYGVGGGELVVRHGLVRQRCKLSEILEVYPTRNPLSSPALSLDRLMVKKGEGFTDSIMISPADKAGFLAVLEAQSGLVREGERLVRRAPPSGS